MKKLMGGAALLAVLAVPSSAAAIEDPQVCARDATNTVSACAYVQTGCIIGSLKGYQYFAPCYAVRIGDG
jgi:hypothetical protein